MHSLPTRWALRIVFKRVQTVNWFSNWDYLMDGILAGPLPIPSGKC